MVKDKFGNEIRVGDLLEKGGVNVSVWAGATNSSSIEWSKWAIVERDGKLYNSEKESLRVVFQDSEARLDGIPAQALNPYADVVQNGGLRFLWRKRPGVEPVEGLNPKPSPLSYADFDRIVREVVAQEAPLAKVVTDGNSERLDAWISCAGVEERFHLGGFMDMGGSRAQGDAKLLAHEACAVMIRRLGEQVVGKR